MVYGLSEISKILVPVCEKYGVKEMVLFGSYAREEATENSDIDLYVDSGLKGIKFYGLLECLTSKLSKSVDLIDKRDIVPGSAIESIIEEEGIKIYGRERQRSFA